MWRIPLNSDDSFLLLAPRFGDWTGAWQWALLAAFLVVPAGLVVWLYRFELRLLTRAAAALLLCLRFVVILLLWFLVAWQPTIATYREEEIPSRVVVAVDMSASMETRDLQRSPEEKQALAGALKLAVDVPDKSPSQPFAQVDALTRSEIVRRLLADKGLLAALAARHQVELVAFDRTLWEGDPKRLADLLGARPKKETSPQLPQSTDLREPLARAQEAAGKGPGKMLGLLLFTDGQHNAGPEGALIQQARDMAGVPIFPVVVGAREPPVDLAVLEVKAPPTALKNTDVALEAWIKVAGVPAQELVVEMTEAGKPAKPEHRKTIKHDGKTRVLSVPFQWKSEDLGPHSLEVKIKAASGKLQEISSDNNVQTAVVRIADDKARVLLIDDEARWEHHYLATAFARDPQVKSDEVLFTQPRIGTTPQDKLEKLGTPRLALPEKKADPKADDPLDAYDCIFLGDVPPGKLPLADRLRLESYVAQRGGTLVLLAGKRHLPAQYAKEGGKAGDPIFKMTPLADLRPLDPEEGVQLTLGGEASLAPFMQIDTGIDENRRRWQEFPKHYWAMVGKPKPGAAVLAYAVAGPKYDAGKPEKEQAAIVVQPYGFGHVLYVGVDSTWRWRYKIGDAYHHRFWGQVVRWATSDKLLPGGNRYVRFGSRQAVVRHGQPAEVHVRLAEDISLKDGELGQIKLWRQLEGGKEEQADVAPLLKNAKQGKLFEAQARNLAAGKYRIEVDIPSLRDKQSEPAEDIGAKKLRHDLFTVLPPEDGELFELAVNWPLTRTLAEETSGRVFTAEDVDEALGLLERRVETKTERDEQRFWQDEPLVWWVFSLMIGLLTVEWIVRKWAGLP